MRLAAIAIAAGSVLALPLARAEPDAAVIARYALRRPGAAPESLVVVRGPDRIEHRYEARGTVEVWRRMRGGEVERTALFPAAKRAVRYTGGDLRALGEPADWPSLRALISDEERARLTRVGSSKVRGQTAPRLRGKLRGRLAELTWLPDLELPAQLTLGKGRDAVSLRLLEVAPCTPARCAPTDGAGLKVLDFADLGDMTYDPFVKQFLRARGGGHTH